MGFSMGLHFGFHASHQHPVVQVNTKSLAGLNYLLMVIRNCYKEFLFDFQHHELTGHRALPVRHGGHDHA